MVRRPSGDGPTRAMKGPRFSASRACWHIFLTSACALALGATDAPAWYNPQAGRWLSRDPIEELGRDRTDEGSRQRHIIGRPAGTVRHPVHLYVLAANDPIAGVDLVGLERVQVAGVYGFGPGQRIPDDNEAIGLANLEVGRLGRDVSAEMFGPHNVGRIVVWMREKHDRGRGTCGFVLFGYSLGGYAIVQAAREVEKDGIHIELMLGMDPVLAFGGHGGVIQLPGNVSDAFSFYQQNGLGPLGVLSRGRGFRGTPYSRGGIANYTGARDPVTARLVSHGDIPFIARRLGGAVQKIEAAKARGEF